MAQKIELVTTGIFHKHNDLEKRMIMSNRNMEDT